MQTAMLRRQEERKEESKMGRSTKNRVQKEYREKVAVIENV